MEVTRPDTRARDGLERPLRVLQVITPSRFSGAERVVLELSQALGQRGHAVTVVTKPLRPFVAALQAAGVPVRVAAIAGKLNAAAPFVLARVARSVGADVIHTHLSTATLWGSVAARLCAVPAVSHVHAVGTGVWYRGAHVLIAVSEAVKRWLVESGVPERRIRVVYTGVSPSRLAAAEPPAAVRAALGVEPSTELVVVVAHLTPKKGHHVLLRALALLAPHRPLLRCVCVGSGTQRAALQAQAAELGVGERALFVGAREDAPNIMNAADVVVLPSVRGEGLSLALIEAAMLAKPAVASEVAGAAEIIKHGETGMLVPPGDPKALADALRLLLQDAELRHQMGLRAREYAAQTFTTERMAAAVEDVYHAARSHV